jgi:hydroxypyruvate reductase
MFKKADFNNCANPETVIRILESTLQAVDPFTCVLKSLNRNGLVLTVNGKRYQLDQFAQVFLFGAGKAALAMGEGVISLLGDRIHNGLLISKTESKKSVSSKKVRIYLGDHPLPARKSIQATRALQNQISDLQSDDLVIFVLSGGASALMTLPVPEIDISELARLNRQLLESGADITEINIVRKHLDSIKGGGLAKFFSPATVISLIISDVMTGDLASIASGPTVGDPSTFQDAFSVLEKYDLVQKAPAVIVKYIRDGIAGKHDETIKPGDPILEKIQNYIIADNETAILAATKAAQKQNIFVKKIPYRLSGDAATAGNKLADLFLSELHNKKITRPFMMIIGGETTVQVHGTGRGGRNLELALASVIKLSGLNNIALISFATDGEDGTTGAAGVIVTGETFQKAKILGLDPIAYLKNNDSQGFFEKAGGLIRTGSTGTNVNDLVFLFAF